MSFVLLLRHGLEPNGFMEVDCNLCANPSAVYNFRCVGCCARMLVPLGGDKDLGARIFAAQDQARKLLGSEMPSEEEVKREFLRGRQ